MGRTLIIISTLTLLFSCRQNKQIDKFVFKPTVEPLSKYSEQAFTEAFFSENHYSYTEWAKVVSSEKLTGLSRPEIGCLQNNLKWTLNCNVLLSI